MPPMLKWSKRSCILFSFCFIRRIRGRAVAPDLKLWILALVTASSLCRVTVPHIRPQSGHGWTTCYQLTTLQHRSWTSCCWNLQCKALRCHESPPDNLKMKVKRVVHTMHLYASVGWHRSERTDSEALIASYWLVISLNNDVIPGLSPECEEESLVDYRQHCWGLVSVPLYMSRANVTVKMQLQFACHWSCDCLHAIWVGF